MPTHEQVDMDGSSSPDIVSVLLGHAYDEPRRQALVFEDEVWTLADLAERSGRLADGLSARGIGRGDRVALHLQNRVEAVLLYLACFRVGAIVVPLNTRLATPELADLVARTRPALYVGERELYGRFESVPVEQLPHSARYLVDGADEYASVSDWRELSSKTGEQVGQDDHVNQIDITIDLDDPAVLLSTSGTTGRSKIVIWSHRTLANIHLSAAGRGIADGEVYALFTPLMHGSGVYVLINSLTQGATVVLVRRFDAAAVLDAMERHRVTALFGLPFMCDALVREQLARPRDVTSLRVATVAGDVCPAAVEAAFERVFGVRLPSFWAATEDVGATVAGMRVGPYMRVIEEAQVSVVDAAGRPVEAGEVGELVVSSPTTSPGFWQDDGTVTQMPGQGFRSGDLVREVGLRLLEYVGRAKDLIIRGGSNISPTEVEEALRAHPDVADAGVAGVPDPELGERVAALLVFSDASREHAVAVADVLDWLGERLAAYKVPEHVVVVDAVPRNALTKVDRVAVAQAVRHPPNSRPRGTATPSTSSI